MQKVSLVCALKNREKGLKEALEDLVSFTKRFPFHWQLVLVIDPSRDSTLQEARDFVAPEEFEVLLLSPPRSIGRSLSLLEGLRASTGEYIIPFSIDFTVPLAEIFNFLQELTSNPSVDLVLGNRMTSRKKWQAKKSSWHWTLEKIILEKCRRQGITAQDPLCAYWAIRRTALLEILPRLQFRSWYFTLELLHESQKQKLQILEVPILSKDLRPSSIPLIREYLRNLF